MRMTRQAKLNPLTLPTAQVLAVVVVLYALDCVPNGMVNPVFTLTAGTLEAVDATARSGMLAKGRATTMLRRPTCKHHRPHQAMRPV